MLVALPPDSENWYDVNESNEKKEKKIKKREILKDRFLEQFFFLNYLK